MKRATMFGAVCLLLLALLVILPGCRHADSLPPSPVAGETIITDTLFSDTESEIESPSPSEQPHSFLEEIESKIMEGYQKVADYESGGMPLAFLEYLPDGFINAGIYTKANPVIPTETMVTQLWYDPERLELVMITQSNWDPSVYQDSGISYSRIFDSGENVNDVYPWAEYYYTREVISDGVSVYLYMLVNTNTDKADCNRILNSLQVGQSIDSDIAAPQSPDAPEKPTTPTSTPEITPENTPEPNVDPVPLSENSAWVEAYADLIMQGNFPPYIMLMDINFDGIPELFFYSSGYGANTWVDIIARYSGHGIEQFSTEEQIPAHFELYKDKKTGETRWMTVMESFRSSFLYYNYEWKWIDFIDLSNVRTEFFFKWDYEVVIIDEETDEYEEIYYLYKNAVEMAEVEYSEIEKREQELFSNYAQIETQRLYANISDFVINSSVAVTDENLDYKMIVDFLLQWV